MRAAIRVKPGSSRDRVGGRAPQAGEAPDALVVAVRAPAVDGRANQAALSCLAKALGCRPSQLSIVSGATTRTKVVEAPDGCAERWNELLDA